MAALKMEEQSICTMELEKQRKDAYRKGFVLRKMFLPAFLVLMIFPTIRFVQRFRQIKEAGGEKTDLGNLLIGYLAQDGMTAILLTLAGMGIAYGLYRKSYQRFTSNFKNQYLLDTLKSVGSFTDLEYHANQGFSYNEIVHSAILPAGLKTIYSARDQLTGSFQNVRFRSGNVETATSRGKHIQELFTGQLIEFSYFDHSKISDGRVQVFSNKSQAFYETLYRESNDSRMGRQRLSFKIETEDTAFNQKFAVYSDQEHNAFYILTPQVLERIKELSDTVDEDFFLVFENEKLYVAFRAARNTFDAYTDVPVEEQRKSIEKDAQLLQCAVNILIQN